MQINRALTFASRLGVAAQGRTRLDATRRDSTRRGATPRGFTPLAPRESQKYPPPGGLISSLPS